MYYITNKKIFREMEEAIKEDGLDAAWNCLFDELCTPRLDDMPTLEEFDRIEHIKGKRIEFHDVGIIRNGIDGGLMDGSFAICAGKKEDTK